MRFVIVGLVLSILFPGIPDSPAGATQVTYLSPQQIGARSDLVISGRVESSESYWNDKHTKIFTRTRIAVDDTYKGSVLPVVEVVQIGGIVGSIKVTAHGAPTWRRGDEVLLFAEAVDAQSYRVTGFCQGKFDIRRHPETGEPYVLAPEVDEVKVLGSPADGERVDRSIGVPLEAFVSHALGHTSREGVAE